MLTALFCLFGVLSASAQVGQWVGYDLSTIDCNDGGRSVGGDGIVAFAPYFSHYLLVFDIKVDSWLTVDLGSEQTINELGTQGNIVFACSDSLLFGYSDIGAVWDTASYDGNLLDANDGFGWSGRLAYFITDQFLYVFDAAIGSWVTYPVTLPDAYASTSGWVMDDYVGIALNRDYPALPRNITYSAHTTSFNEIDRGATRTTPYMDHGFARAMPVGDDFRLVGYSAYDNQFDVVDYTTIAGENAIGANNAGNRPADEFTVYMESFRYAESYDFMEANFYAYDTRYGNWNHKYVYFDYDDEYYAGGCVYGGQVASDYSRNKADDSPRLFLFGGSGGVYRDFSTSHDIYDSWSLRGGGDCFMCWDDRSAWAYNVFEDYGATLNWIGENKTNVYSGQDYFTITRWSDTSATMRTYFYNSRTNNWQYVDLPEHHTDDGLDRAHYYLHIANPENIAVYYSSYLDRIISYDFPDGSRSFKMCGNLAYARTATESGIFDGLNGSVHVLDFDFHDGGQHGLGTNSAVFYDDNVMTAYGYSNLYDHFTTQSYTEDILYCRDTGYIGIMANNGYYKIYTYNGLTDAWVEMSPPGLHQSLVLAEKTAVMFRTQSKSGPDHVYAFDPESVVVDVDTEEIGHKLPDRFALSQNHPNPFNPVTTIEYSLPVRSRVAIEIHNILGQRIRTLVDRDMPAGSYTVTWDGTDDSGSRVASGVYLYRIDAADFVSTKKMILLK